MANYFRITAYHPIEDLSLIIDSNGKFKELWEFSSYLVKKGFKILEVGDNTKFLDGNLGLTPENPDKIVLRACTEGRPQYTTFQQNGIEYHAIQIRNKIYIPDRNKKEKLS